MTRSATSTDGPVHQAESGFRPWHFYILLSMAGATGAVMLARDTHPVALLLLSSAVVAAGLVGLAFHYALGGFLGVAERDREGLRETDREVLAREKLLTLRSIKELEFDREMGKVSDVDYQDMAGRLRARAMWLIEELEREPPPKPEPKRAAVSVGTCAECGTENDRDARFCKSCGTKLDRQGGA
jgi:hypothetical protein